MGDGPQFHDFKPEVLRASRDAEGQHGGENRGREHPFGLSPARHRVLQGRSSAVYGLRSARDPSHGWGPRDHRDHGQSVSNTAGGPEPFGREPERSAGRRGLRKADRRREKSLASGHRHRRLQSLSPTAAVKTTTDQYRGDFVTETTKNNNAPVEGFVAVDVCGQKRCFFLAADID